MNESAPLPDDLLEYLAAAREVEAPSSATKERLLARLGPLLPPIGGVGSPSGEGSSGDTSASGGMGGGLEGAGASASSTAAQGAATTAVGAASLLKGKLVVAAVSAMIGAAGGATMHAAIAPRQTVATNVTVAVAPPIDRMPSTASVPSALVPEPPLPTASVSTTSSPPVESTAVRKSSMRAERILLEAANAALMRGDHAAAMASLQQHARTYPRGELAQERDILISQATKLKATDKTAAPR